MHFASLTKRGNLSAKDVIAQKENAQDAREISEAMQERVPAPNLHVWSRRAQFNGLDQKLTGKILRPSRNEDKLCDREDYVEDQEILENKEEQLNQLKETLEAKENEIRSLRKTG